MTTVSDKQQVCLGSRSRREPMSTGMTRILLVVLKDLDSSVRAMEDFFWIFSQFGVVEKLSSFTKNSKNQLLIQFAGSSEAGKALSYLNGKVITIRNTTNGELCSCHMEIVPSFLKELNFKKLDSRNCDYSELNTHLSNSFPSTSLVIAGGWTCCDFLWGNCIGTSGWLYPMQEAEFRGTIPPAKESLLNNNSGLPQGKAGDCVKLSGLPEGEFTAEQLFRVAGMYGEIVSAKLMAKRKGCALVQYTSKEAADVAIAKLNGKTIFGNAWSAVTSKHANALHWNGAGTELQERMCTLNNIDRPTVPSPELVGSPSHYIGIRVEDESVDAVSLLREALEGFNPAEVDCMMEHDAIAGFDNKEDAFTAVSKLNGKVVNGVKLVLYFIAANDYEEVTEELPSEEEEEFWGRFNSDDSFRIKTTGGLCTPSDSDDAFDEMDIETRQRTL
eukprot:TRINITY_DN1892_c1_g3_i1.p1 TRINITY_DN1892_c1_g3~~TRINITY_DN1892_c1_g3_i1.p1  ORF type:complete len:444 (+),score=120.41 TRINITY_DN1892_c1_g3_i1:53-1384(+)